MELNNCQVMCLMGEGTDHLGGGCQLSGGGCCVGRLSKLKTNISFIVKTMVPQVKYFLK